MGRKPTYKVADFIDAIKDSNGIIDTIAKRVGCNWETARRHIAESSTLTTLFNEELEARKDLAESLLIQNMKLAELKQLGGEIVDTSDAKWYLSKKAKDRGYQDSQKINVSLEDELDKALDALEKNLPIDQYEHVLSVISRLGKEEIGKA